VHSFGFGDVHFIVRLCYVTIALVFKLVTWILRHRGLAITACKAGLRILSDDNLQQQDENASQAGEEMSTADAVSLFTTSLNSALAQQKQDILSELQPNRQSSTAMCKESSINSSCQPDKFKFKQEGTKKQLNFNSESIDTLGRISSLISQCKFDDTRALINSVLDTLCQRNKILKIADRHGWDTVNEYLDDLWLTTTRMPPSSGRSQTKDTRLPKFERI
jgi:hypothetical protein